jgi:serine/threonine protein kinase
MTISSITNSPKKLLLFQQIIDIRPLRFHENFNLYHIYREINIMKKLINHTNIIKFHSYYHESDTFMMIMEYFDGVNLLDMILLKKLTIENDIKSIFQQITFALYYLHCCNIIHRDVKPENILISYDKLVSSASSSFHNNDKLSVHNTNNNNPNITHNNSINNSKDYYHHHHHHQHHHHIKYHVKLLDFGLSINNGTGSNAKTFVGTPCYVAPEVQYNSGSSNSSSSSSSSSSSYGSSYSFPVDCWSLGAVLYVMLVARFPEFENKKKDCNNFNKRSSRDDHNYCCNSNYIDNDDDDDDDNTKHSNNKKVVVKLPSSLFQHISFEAQDLITGLMDINPITRLTMKQALLHPWLLRNICRSSDSISSCCNNTSSGRCCVSDSKICCTSCQSYIEELNQIEASTRYIKELLQKEQIENNKHGSSDCIYNNNNNNNNDVDMDCNDDNDHNNNNNNMIGAYNDSCHGISSVNHHQHHYFQHEYNPDYIQVNNHGGLTYNLVDYKYNYGDNNYYNTTTTTNDHNNENKYPTTNYHATSTTNNNVTTNEIVKTTTSFTPILNSSVTHSTASINNNPIATATIRTSTSITSVNLNDHFLGYNSDTPSNIVNNNNDCYINIKNNDDSNNDHEDHLDNHENDLERNRLSSDNYSSLDQKLQLVPLLNLQT